MGQCHKISQGGGRGSAKVSRFSKNIRLHFGIFDCFKHNFFEKPKFHVTHPVGGQSNVTK